MNINDSFGLPKGQCIKVISEIEAHTGILIQSSYNTYEFVHKSMQEYLAAEHIVKMPEIPRKLLHNTNISNELAITVALSSDPNSYFLKLVFDVFKGSPVGSHFIMEFLSRLAYEKPDFQESILLPYCFAKITQRYIDNDLESHEKIIDIVEKFKEIHNVRMSFKKFALNIQTSVENIEQLDFPENASEDTDEKSDLLGKFDLEIDHDDHLEMNVLKFINIELEDVFSRKLKENESSYANELRELRIPLNVYQNSFQ